jgi:hypothetical protein
MKPTWMVCFLMSIVLNARAGAADGPPPARTVSDVDHVFGLDEASGTTRPSGGGCVTK